MGDRVEAILRVWFGDPTDPGSDYGQQRSIWFKKNPEFDQTVRERFWDDYQQAAAGQLQPWRQQPRSCLALILLLDQLPRNMFRGHPQSFATDDQAREAAEYALDQGFDQQLLPVERLFVYVPFEHSENLAHQQRAVALFAALSEAEPELSSTLDYAIRHRDIIQRFGRFPHRNGILNRATTTEEAAFLQQPGSGF
ncbi:uncharacterized protein XM38_038150 [Halomicronema hongdechloris C2206]|uniref:DUF924 domain-containing protein n=1 Tax=Halomicronema hongdechloris C2206 TaxID=1641165 RepID=A0A1Z3HRF0_9CYAN|nr:DUF924 family protein [Halomicronema hongdechloris]ASC72855.1 uncharacterized protein XM38_038150 [Halomicronema hongdechloris C2206]